MAQIEIKSLEGYSDSGEILFGVGSGTPKYFPKPTANNAPTVVADQAARLALSAIVGDVVKQTDTGEVFSLGSLPASTNGNWILLVPGGVNAQTGTSYTLLASDKGKTVTLNNASAITLTVPSGLGANFECVLIQLGAGQVTITPSSTTIHNRQSFTKLAGQYAACVLKAYAANVFISQGDMAA